MFGRKKRLNILFITSDFSDTPTLHVYHDLEQEVMKLANCKKIPPEELDGKSLYPSMADIMPNVDWVITYDFEIEKKDLKIAFSSARRRHYKVATYVADLQRWPADYVKHLNNRYDAVLMMYTQLGAALDFKDRKRRRGMNIVPIKPDFYLGRLKCPHFHLAACINPELFKPMDREPRYDVTFLGAVGYSCYPLRDVIFKELPDLARHENWRMLRKTSPWGASLNRQTSKLFDKGEIVGRRYADVLALSKVFIFGTSIFKYPLLKFPEAMACGTCVMADVPLGAEEFHLEPDWNFVAITESNWKRKLKYYLTHDEERKQIAQRGYETVMKYHTTEIRAKQLVDWLEAHK